MSYVSVTEKPGIRITREAYRMLVTRYAYAAQFCEGRDVLEVACGAGMGLGLLASHARSVVGGDIDEELLGVARETYQDRVQLFRLDAHDLPFPDESLDVVLLFEAIYYLSRPEKFIGECRRVLRPLGRLLICTANREWHGFNRSPFSYRYWSAEELRQLLIANGFDAEISGAFPTNPPNLAQHAVQVARRLAVLLHLIPKTMQGKEWLKRLFYGQLVPIEPEITSREDWTESVHAIAPDRDSACYKVLYAAGHVPAGRFVEHGGVPNRRPSLFV